MKHSSRTDWERLKNMSDNQIDYSDIPETDLDFWEDAEILYPNKKIEIKIEVDEDIAIWIKQFGDKSNKAINNLLRSYLISSKQIQINK